MSEPLCADCQQPNVTCCYTQREGGKRLCSRCADARRLSQIRDDMSILGRIEHAAEAAYNSLPVGAAGLSWNRCHESIKEAWRVAARAILKNALEYEVRLTTRIAELEKQAAMPGLKVTRRQISRRPERDDDGKLMYDRYTIEIEGFVEAASCCGNCRRFVSKVQRFCSECMRPQFTHDCDRCVFLGRYQECDLYFCKGVGFPTVLARWGSEGPEYTSGLGLAHADHRLGEAKRRAIERGLLPSEASPSKEPLLREAATVCSVEVKANDSGGLDMVATETALSRLADGKLNASIGRPKIVASTGKLVRSEPLYSQDGATLIGTKHTVEAEGVLVETTGGDVPVGGEAREGSPASTPSIRDKCEEIRQRLAARKK
jgi:hypothetical protein